MRHNSQAINGAGNARDQHRGTTRGRGGNVPDDRAIHRPEGLAHLYLPLRERRHGSRDGCGCLRSVRRRSGGAGAGVWGEVVGKEAEERAFGRTGKGRRPAEESKGRQRCEEKRPARFVRMCLCVCRSVSRMPTVTTRKGEGEKGGGEENLGHPQKLRHTHLYTQVVRHTDGSRRTPKKGRL